MPALIFDCDGVLADTERDGHLVAFNRMFEELGLPVHWSEAEYREKLRIAGGKERLASMLSPSFVAACGLSEDEAVLRSEVERWHRRKTELFRELVFSGAVPPRPGVRRLAREALEEGVRLAVASTSAEASVRAVLERAVGSEVAAEVLVLAGDVVKRKKPDPEVYLLALASLGLRDGDAVVIEDSQMGLASARAAGLACVVTVSSFTSEEDFHGAAFVVSTLGEPGGEQAIVLENALGVTLGGWVSLASLRGALAVPGKGG